MSKHKIQIRVNESLEELEIPAHRLLSDALRNDLHLTGTKRGCETGVCGACSILLNGRLVKSCLTLAIQADNGYVTTIEGMSCAGKLHPLQESFISCGGLQCGYCTPGMIMTAHAFLKENPTPSEDEVRTALGANLCRCTGYNGIVDSVMHAANVMRDK